MSIPSTNYGKIIDQLRKDRKISRDDLVDGIMSKRNYQRFTSGETSIPNSKLSRLVDKMLLDFIEVNQFIMRTEDHQKLKFREMFELFRQMRYKECLIKLSGIDKDLLVSDSSKQIYNYIDTVVAFALDDSLTSVTIDKLSKLLDYPNILNYSTINSIELNGLIHLNGLLSNNQDSSITDYLFEMLSSKKSNIIGWEAYKAPIAYASLARGYYRLSNYERCVEACNLGIETSRLSGIGFATLNLYSYKALAFNRMLMSDDAIDAAIKVYLLLNVEDNPARKETYIRILNENLNIDIEEFVQIKKGT